MSEAAAAEVADPAAAAAEPEVTDPAKDDEADGDAEGDATAERAAASPSAPTAAAAGAMDGPEAAIAREAAAALSRTRALEPIDQQAALLAALLAAPVPTCASGDKQVPVTFARLCGSIALFGEQRHERADDPPLITFSAAALAGLSDSQELQMGPMFGPLKPFTMPTKRGSARSAHYVLMFMFVDELEGDTVKCAAFNKTTTSEVVFMLKNLTRAKPEEALDPSVKEATMRQAKLKLATLKLGGARPSRMRRTREDPPLIADEYVRARADSRARRLALAHTCPSLNLKLPPLPPRARATLPPRLRRLLHVRVARLLQRLLRLRLLLLQLRRWWRLLELLHRLLGATALQTRRRTRTRRFRRRRRRRRASRRRRR